MTDLAPGPPRSVRCWLTESVSTNPPESTAATVRLRTKVTKVLVHVSQELPWPTS